MEGSDYRDPTDASSDHAHPLAWFGATNVARDRVWLAINLEIRPNRHGTLSNYLFADAHVERLESKQIGDWAEQLIDFALPNEFPR